MARDESLERLKSSRVRVAKLCAATLMRRYESSPGRDGTQLAMVESATAFC